MRVASATVRWLVLSAWLAIASALPFCAPAKAFERLPAAARSSATLSCVCGDPCRCLACLCDDVGSHDRQVPPAVPSSSRELGVFVELPDSLSVPSAEIGIPLARSSASSRYSLACRGEPRPTLVAQCICLRI